MGVVTKLVAVCSAFVVGDKFLSATWANFIGTKPIVRLIFIHGYEV